MHPTIMSDLADTIAADRRREAERARAAAAAASRRSAGLLSSLWPSRRPPAPVAAPELGAAPRT